MTIDQAQEVFGILGAQWPAGSVMRYFARKPDGGTHGETILGPVHLSAVTNHADRSGYNSYVQMNPTNRKGNGRCNASDVTHWSWFLVDLDPIGPSPKLEDAKQFVEYFMSNYLGMQHLKYTLIDSGRGWQMWFPLSVWALSAGPMDKQIVLRTEPLMRDFELSDSSYLINTVVLPLREAASRAMSYWLDLLKERMQQVLPDCGVTIDTSVSDLPRVMRLPYTMNYKTLRPTSVLHRTEGWNPALGDKLLNYAPYHVWRVAQPVDYIVSEGAPWQHYLVHPGMKVNARIYLTEGAHEGGRHKAATAAMLSMKELGCTATQAEAALLWGASLCSPPLEPREITPMIDRHFQRRQQA